MAIVKLPTHVAAAPKVDCIICGRQISYELATAGLYNAKGELVFFCAGHFWNAGEFITGLADYTAQERLELLRAGIEPARIAVDA